MFIGGLRHHRYAQNACLREILRSHPCTHEFFWVFDQPLVNPMRLILGRLR